MLGKRKKQTDKLNKLLDLGYTATQAVEFLSQFTDSGKWIGKNDPPKPKNRPLSQRSNNNNNIDSDEEKLIESYNQYSQPYKKTFWNNWNPNNRIIQKKYHDIPPSTVEVHQNGQILQCLNSIGVGTDAYDRVGQRVRWKSIELKMNIIPGWAHYIDTALDIYGEPAMVKIQLIWDSQTNGSVPTMSDIYTPSLGAYQNLRFLYADNRERFKVLFDENIQLDGGTITNGRITSGGSYQQSKFVHKFLLLDKETQYSGPTDAVGSISTGSLLLVVMTTARKGNSPADAYPFQGQCYIQWASRMRFVE